MSRPPPPASSRIPSRIPSRFPSRFPGRIPSVLNSLREGLNTLGQKTGLKKPPPIVLVTDLSDFVRDQAAFVSQVALYTYVKARAGTSFPKLFQHQDFLTSLHIARWHIFAAAVIDLALFSADQLRTKTSNTNTGDSQAKQETLALARYLSQVAFLGIKQSDVSPKVFSDALAGIEGRVSGKLAPKPQSIAKPKPTPFFASADAFLHWAPMAEEFKKDDEEIMRNSIEMRWIEVRREFHRRLDADAVYADWVKSEGEGR